MSCLLLLPAQVSGVALQQPFARMTYAECMERYGCDKPDLRYGLEHADVSQAVQGSTFRHASKDAVSQCYDDAQMRGWNATSYLAWILLHWRSQKGKRPAPSMCFHAGCSAAHWRAAAS